MRLAIIAFAVLSAACARYDYTTRAADGVQQSIRVDRLTGETQAFSSNAGWVTLKPAPRATPIPASIPCTPDEISAANQPENAADRYLPERIRARNRHCRTIRRES